MKFLVLLVFVGLGLVSCNKEEGQGGDSTIRGKILQRVFDEDYKILQSSLPLGNEDVFIVYGSDVSVSDKVETNYDGTFEFKYLQKGSYKIFYYSQDSTGVATAKVAVVKEVQLGDGSTTELGDLIKYKTLNVDEGTASIKGKVIVTNHKSNWTDIKDVGPAQDQDVFLVYRDNTAGYIRARTDYAGNFEFRNLIKGDYIIYVYSDEQADHTQKRVVSTWVQVVDDNEAIKLADFNIDKL